MYQINLWVGALGCTVKPGFSKLFEKHKNVYYCQVFTIYHVIYTRIANFGKKQKFTNAWSLLSIGLLSPGSTVNTERTFSYALGNE